MGGREGRLVRSSVLVDEACLKRPLHVDVRIGAAGLRAGADTDEAAGLGTAVNEVMTVAHPFRPDSDVARAHFSLAIAVNQNRPAGQHDQKLVLAFVPMPLARPGAGLQYHMPRAEFGKSAGFSDLALPALRDRFVEGRRIAGAVGLLEGVEVDL